MTTDPRDLLNQSAMTAYQVMLIAFVIALNALAVLNIVSTSFVLPGIASEWRSSMMDITMLTSIGAAGMALGALCLGGVADQIGRRLTIMLCLLLMALGMIMTSIASDFLLLSIWKIVTGIGVGGMVVSMTVLVAEFSNSQSRPFCISVIGVGSFIGSVFGAVVAVSLLESYGWRSVFYFVAGLNVIFILIVYLMLPESVFWLIHKQPAGALEKIN